MTQELTPPQSIAPTRYSTRHRISVAILLLPITILLLGCPRWTISKILVNPQPLAGNETVFPVVLFAPTSSKTTSRQDVVIEVVFDRNKDFTDPIAFKVNYYYYHPQLNSHVVSNSSLFFGASSHRHAVILNCLCTRIEEPGRDPFVELLVLGTSKTPVDISLTVTGSAKAKTALDIEVVSKHEGAEEYVTAFAAKALEISCLRDSPIQ